MDLATMIRGDLEGGLLGIWPYFLVSYKRGRHGDPSAFE